MRLREEERDAGERQEQPRGKAGHHGVGAEPSQVDANHPGQGDRQEPDVDSRRAAHDDGD